MQVRRQGRRAQEVGTIVRLYREASEKWMSLLSNGLLSNGKVCCEFKTPYRDRTTHAIFEPMDFIARLVALAPKEALQPNRPKIGRYGHVHRKLDLIIQGSQQAGIGNHERQAGKPACAQVTAVEPDFTRCSVRRALKRSPRHRRDKNPSR